ncbi:unnamed protein product [marine sediment metagenome]|uniref:Uncharacterized protein n=1 Tax=marine sediment metagenome TaxID=412755 RepID=X0SWY0_9ZZZZ
MSVEFFQTIMGKRFYEGTAPRIADKLSDIAKELKRANDLKEKELATHIVLPPT